jgi:uncharacterized phosphosugar-binding protein
LRRFDRLSCFDALPVEASASDGDSVLEVYEFVAVEVNRLLAAPAEAVYPSRISQSHALRALALMFNNDFDPPVFARRLEDVRRPIITGLHCLLLQKNRRG